MVVCNRKAQFSEYNTLASLVAQGKSNEEIAGTLETSEGSVKQMLHRMFRKFKVNNRLQLVALYVASHMQPKMVSAPSSLLKVPDGGYLTK